MVSDEPSMLYSAVNNDDDEVEGSDGDEAVSSQSESDDDNDPEEGEFQTPPNPINPVNPITENTVQQWERSQWFSNARYDYTQSGAFLDIDSDSPLDDIIESVANDPEIPVSNIIQEPQVLYQTGCTYKQAWYARKFAIERFLRIELKSREHKVTTYNSREGIYMVKSPIRVSGTGNNVYTLRLNNKFFVENGKHKHCLVLMFLQCVEKMGQEQILMCRRYIRDEHIEELTKRIFIRS
ncbi:hypothetical protein M9H77_16505 [Catharanthus roseus]|uniref:Uncharacterized protein n=1 Tax=Catharanthus roseus TaxID=4058 RepID=A0ACC0B248_CATRO|nr:hypothetical protein M9H77_16505 [Catharanthus roseus]